MSLPAGNVILSSFIAAVIASEKNTVTTVP
jgi:hypothetical protein